MLRGSSPGDEVDAPDYQGGDPLDGAATETDGTDSGEASGDSSDPEDDASGAGDDDDGAPEPPGSTEDDAGLISLDPEAGSSDHHYRDPLVLTFASQAAETIVTVTGPAGPSSSSDVAVNNRWNEDETEVRKPDALARTSDAPINGEQPSFSLLDLNRQAQRAKHLYPTSFCHGGTHQEPGNSDNAGALSRKPPLPAPAEQQSSQRNLCF